MTIRINTLVNNIIDGTCFERFSKMSEKAQMDTAIKTVGVAIVANIISGGIPALGLVGSVLFSGAASLGAFAYMTTNYGATNFARDHIGSVVDRLRSQF